MSRLQRAQHLSVRLLLTSALAAGVVGGCGSDASHPVQADPSLRPRGNGMIGSSGHRGDSASVEQTGYAAVADVSGDSLRLVETLLISEHK